MIAGMKWNRQQFIDLVTFRPHPRPMFVELFGTLVGLDDEWRAQGASEDEINLSAFDFDWVPITGVGCSTGCRGMPERIIEDSPIHQVKIDFLGRTARLDKRTATIALPETFPVRTMDDWIKFKPMYAFDESRISFDGIERARALQAQGSMVIAGIPGAFDTLRNLMGEENACLAYYEEPELVADVIATLTDTAVRVLGPVCEKIELDQLSVHEDFAGRSGPIVGPEQIRQTFNPLYGAAWEIARASGCEIFRLDTDGNVNSVMDALLDTGLTFIYPMEPAAGMDIVQVRQKFGRRVAFAGGIDKHVLRQSRADIRKELDYKLQPLVREPGGAVFGLDHRIPNGTPLDHYRYYVDTAREILGLPRRDGKSKGWARMAF